MFDFAVELYSRTYALQKRQFLDDGKDEETAENTARTLASNIVKGSNVDLTIRCQEFILRWPELEVKKSSR